MSSNWLDIHLPDDNTRLQRLCGPLDAHLRLIEHSLGVQIKRRIRRFQVSGEFAKQAIEIIEFLYNQSHQEITVEEVQLALAQSRTLPLQTNEGSVQSPDTVLLVRKAPIRGRTANQVSYLKSIQQHDVAFGVGPAGTGKTYLAVACAVASLESEQVQRIILTRPAVEAGERLGFLPGDLAQKIDPYLRPLYDALYDLLGFERTQKCFEKQMIEIAPLAYMRGRTLNNAFIILDEAQNTTPEQMKMFLTRIGFGSKAVITGDPTQIDLPKGHKSGLVEALDVLRLVKGIGFTHFSSRDVVRHPLVVKIVEAYAKLA